MIKLGEVPESVVLTGCPSIDMAVEVRAAALDFDPFERYGGVGRATDLSKGYIVVMQHPGDHRIRGGAAAGRRDAVRGEGRGLPVLWFWPNVDAGSDGTSKGIRVFRERRSPANFHFFRNMMPEDFLRLLVPNDGDRRQFQRGDSRVLVPGRAGGEHRQPPDRARARRAT